MRTAVSSVSLLADFFIREYRMHPQRTVIWWARRWDVKVNTVAAWIAGVRRIAKRYQHVFSDLPFTMKYYYAAEASRITQRPFVVLALLPAELRPLFKGLVACYFCHHIVPGREIAKHASSHARRKSKRPRHENALVVLGRGVRINTHGVSGGLPSLGRRR